MAEEPRIEIRPNGPYVIHGDVPLFEMAPVHTFNGEPVAWHTLREIPVRGRPVELCRCGQSSNKPFCDSSHETNGFSGTETADKRPFLVRADIVGSEAVAIADDHSLCFSAGFCGTRTTTVWKLLEQSADPKKLEAMREMIWQCPSGTLALLQQGHEVEPELPRSVAILPGGPIWVRSALQVLGSAGEPWETRNRVTLCRCGGSANKPFCDETHAAIHFDER